MSQGIFSSPLHEGDYGPVRSPSTEPAPTPESEPKCQCGHRKSSHNTCCSNELCDCKEFRDSAVPVSVTPQPEGGPTGLGLSALCDSGRCVDCTNKLCMCECHFPVSHCALCRRKTTRLGRHNTAICEDCDTNGASVTEALFGVSVTEGSQVCGFLIEDDWLPGGLCALTAGHEGEHSTREGSPSEAERLASELEETADWFQIARDGLYADMRKPLDDAAAMLRSQARELEEAKADHDEANPDMGVLRAWLEDAQGLLAIREAKNVELSRQLEEARRAVAYWKEKYDVRLK